MLEKLPKNWALKKNLKTSELVKKFSRHPEWSALFKPPYDQILLQMESYPAQLRLV